jgi:hypothetical protein
MRFLTAGETKLIGRRKIMTVNEAKTAVKYHARVIYSDSHHEYDCYRLTAFIARSKYGEYWYQAELTEFYTEPEYAAGKAKGTIIASLESIRLKDENILNLEPIKANG